MVNEEEPRGDSKPDVTDVSEEETRGGKGSTHVKGKGEVMRGIGEGGCGEKQRAGICCVSAVGNWGSSKPGCGSNCAGGAKSRSKMEDS